MDSSCILQVHGTLSCLILTFCDWYSRARYRVTCKHAHNCSRKSHAYAVHLNIVEPHLCSSDLFWRSLLIADDDQALSSRTLTLRMPALRLLERYLDLRTRCPNLETLDFRTPCALSEYDRSYPFLGMCDLTPLWGVVDSETKSLKRLNLPHNQFASGYHQDIESVSMSGLLRKSSVVELGLDLVADIREVIEDAHKFAGIMHSLYLFPVDVQYNGLLVDMLADASNLVELYMIFPRHDVGLKLLGLVQQVLESCQLPKLERLHIVGAFVPQGVVHALNARLGKSKIKTMTWNGLSWCHPPPLTRGISCYYQMPLCSDQSVRSSLVLQ
jgi:hypothetical protein